MLVSIFCFLAIISLFAWLASNHPKVLAGVFIGILSLFLLALIAYIILDISGITFLGI